MRPCLLETGQTLSSTPILRKLNCAVAWAVAMPDFNSIFHPRTLGNFLHVQILVKRIRLLLRPAMNPP